MESTGYIKCMPQPGAVAVMRHRQERTISKPNAGPSFTTLKAVKVPEIGFLGDHGVYLFHSVPTDQSNHIVESQADKLGKSAASHGCVRLSLPDSKWMYDTIPEGTKVVIDND